MGEIRQAMDLAEAQLHLKRVVAKNKEYLADEAAAKELFSKIPERIAMAVREGHPYVDICHQCKVKGDKDRIEDLTGVAKILVSMLILHENCVVEDFSLQTESGDRALFLSF